MTLLLLPYEVIEQVMGICLQQEIVLLSYCCKELHKMANKRLYSNIMVMDSRVDAKDYSVLDVEQLDRFVTNLSGDNFSLMNKLVIHSQSNMVSYDYYPLYKKLMVLWESHSHEIYFVNFDIGNIRNFKSLNQFVMGNSMTYLEDEDNFEVHSVYSNKVRHLKNWIVFNIDELVGLPFNENLKDLDLYIEHQNFHNVTEKLNHDILNNLSNLNGLFLDSPASTTEFINVFKGKLRLHNLKKLSISASHNIRDNSMLSFGSVNEVINFDKISEFELKINCIHENCNCIQQFFNDWITRSDDLIYVKRLALVNYNSEILPQNLLQFKNCLEEELISGSICAEELYLNFSDLIRLEDGCFSMDDLWSKLSNVRGLKKLIIPDFFYTWIKSAAHLFETDNATPFDVLVNQCSCELCSKTRGSFMKNSKKPFFDYQTFLNFESNPQVKYVPENKENLKLLYNLAYGLKTQFRYLNQTLFSVNSFLNLDDKPVIDNPKLLPFKKLLLHSCIHRLANSLKHDIPTLRLLNLGGITVEF
ncbi:uncharacterized protein PRCAT00005306001 [Priceomyces carsonii]|uniref:uncharacterized protein n=1 Tax=Priceomyces carsonii TaxID=28549 RepID=UPI002EDAC5F9|nr:unnamed protein product [Priceomyces carsonii]